MKKKLNFLLCVILTLCIAAGGLSVGVASYDNDVVTSSSGMLLINLDTDTEVFSLNPDVKWYAGGMSKLMTLILVGEKVRKPAQVKITVDEAFFSTLPYSDGCLKPYYGRQLTVKDLMAVMMLTSGSDAAYFLADYVSEGDIPAFVDEMNTRAEALGCQTTHYESPGYIESDQHYTNCYDTRVIYEKIKDRRLYHAIMDRPVYILDEYNDEAEEAEARKEIEKDESKTVKTQTSIMNPDSPYYFRYTTGAVYAKAPFSRANLVATTSYRDSNYLFVAIRGKTKSEENVYADARKLTTWAYLNLSDRKVIDVDDSVMDVRLKADWGEYELSLYAENSAYKTLPNEYQNEKLDYKTSLKKGLELPVFRNEQLGTAKIYYDKQKVDTVSLISPESAGVSLLQDTAMFIGAAYREMIPELPTEAPTEAPTQGPTKAKKTEKQSQTAPSEQPTER